MRNAEQVPAQQKEDRHVADPPRHTDIRDDAGEEPDPAARTGTSRWQKVVGILGLVVLLWVGNQMLNTLLGRGPGPGGMDHGPGQDPPPAEIQEQEADSQDGDGHRPPPGGRDH
jgi:hypothetical protein